MMLDNLKVFVAAAQYGSLSRAASQMHLTVATVSRRINALESDLGCQLLHRSPRGLTLTASGEMYFSECADLIQALDARLESLDQTLNSLKGTLKVLAPTNMACGPLDDFWQDFTQCYPDIELTLDFSNIREDMVASQADIAIRVGPQPDSSLIQKKLGSTSTVLVAGVGQREVPVNLEQLQVCPSIASDLLQQWDLQDIHGEKVSLSKQHRHISNNLQMVINLVVAGAGIAMLPLSLVQILIERGQLQHILPEWQGPVRDIFLVWPHRRSLSARGALFKQELTAFLAQQPWCNPP